MVDFVLETEEDPEWSLADSRESRPEPDWVADPEWSTAPQRCSTPDPPPSPQTLRLSEKIGKVVENLQTRISSVTTMASLSAGRLPSSMPTGWPSWSGSSDDTTLGADGLFPDTPEGECNLQNAWSSAIFGDL
jgi:hypothetical protein